MNNVNNVKENKLSSRMITMSAVMAAVMCILAPFSIPIGPVPISLTNLIIYISLYVLGMKQTLISYLTYLLIGLVGLPVFSGFHGGVARLFGPTGGYLIGFIFMVIITGRIIDRHTKWQMCLVGMILGTLVCYAFGTSWLAYQTGMDFTSALFAGVIPFIPGDLIKIGIALLYGPRLQKQLSKI